MIIRELKYHVLVVQQYHITAHSKYLRVLFRNVSIKPSVLTVSWGVPIRTERFNKNILQRGS